MFDPTRIVESGKKAFLGIEPEPEEYSITSDEGGIRKELPISIPTQEYQTPPPQQAIFVDKSRPEMNVPAINPELIDMAVTDMPFLYPYRRKRGAQII